MDNQNYGQQGNQYPNNMGSYNPYYRSEKKTTAGILGVFLGYLGVHKFYLGYTTEGLIQIGITIASCGIGSIIGFIEGIIYLTKSDQEFDQTYVYNKKGWF